MTPQDAADLVACERVASLFSHLLDEGDLEAAFALHHDDVQFFGPDGSGPFDRTGAREDAAKVRFAYPGRRTLHLISNFIGSPLPDGTVEARYYLTVYELTERAGEQTLQLAAPRIFVLAQETAIFSRAATGDWKYQEQRLSLVAPVRNPA